MIWSRFSHKNKNWEDVPWGYAMAQKEYQQFHGFKGHLLETRDYFQAKVLDRPSPAVPNGTRFKQLLERIRSTLYSDVKRRDDDKEITRICEELFKQIMRLIDSFLDDRHGHAWTWKVKLGD